MVEEVTKDGYSCQVSIAQILATPTAEFAKGKLHTVEAAKTVPEAICLTALAVIELERKVAKLIEKRRDNFPEIGCGKVCLSRKP